MPNFRGRRFTNAHETLIWAAKSDSSKYVFNYDALKELNEGTQMRSDWLIPICTGEERLKDNNGKKIHPTQKPVEVLRYFIELCTNTNDKVLDTFAGSGSTGIACKETNRQYVLIERDTKMFSLMKKKLS